MVAMKLTIPELCLVVVLGPSSRAKATFLQRHFRPTEVLSLPSCRAMIHDGQDDPAAAEDALRLMCHLAGRRLARRRLTVIDGGNSGGDLRRWLTAVARRFYCQPVAIVFDLPRRAYRPEVSQAQPGGEGTSAAGRWPPPPQPATLAREGFSLRFLLQSVEEAETATVERLPLPTDRRDEHGPFDIIGDVHGCFAELQELLHRLGYGIEPEARAEGPAYRAGHPEGRKAIFLGDLADRGPAIPEVLGLAMNMTAADAALCLPGNHDLKLLRKLQGRNVQVAHGLAESLAQIERTPPPFAARLVAFLEGLPSHYWLDEGRLAVAHAGIKEAMQGRDTRRVRDFALYGETTGEVDEYGVPIRLNWAAAYRGRALVIYGHTPVHQPEWLNGTINIDTGCVFGGRLTALRYPELELVSVPAARVYYHMRRAFSEPGDPTEITPPRPAPDEDGECPITLDKIVGSHLS